MKAVEIKKILDEIGLELVSAHVNLNLIEDDAVLDDFAATGMKYIAIPWLTGPKNAEELKSTIERIQKAGERCKAKECSCYITIMTLNLRRLTADISWMPTMKKFLPICCRQNWMYAGSM